MHNDLLQKKLHLEDFSVGDEFLSDSILIEEAQIRAFAEQFDPQPFHTDTDAAKTTFFGGLAASGWHTAAITMRLLVASVPIAGGVIGAGSEITWPRPTRPLDKLHVVSTVLSVLPSKSKPDRGIVVLESQTSNQHGDICQISRAKILVFRRTTT